MINRRPSAATLAGVVMLVIAGALVVIALAVLSKTFDPNADSADSAYVKSAAEAAGIAIVPLVIGIYLLRRR